MTALPQDSVRMHSLMPKVDNPLLHQKALPHLALRAMAAKPLADIP